MNRDAGAYNLPTTYDRILVTRSSSTSRVLYEYDYRKTREHALAWHQCGGTLNVIPRRGRIIHGATYFDDAGRRSPVRDVATIVPYDKIAARSSHGAQPTTAARHSAVSVRPGTAPCLRTNGREKLWTNYT